MSNPYQSPAPMAAPGQRSKIVRMVLVYVGLIFASLAAMMPAVVLPHYDRLYRGFGIEMPVLAQAFVRHAAWFWLLPVLVIAVRLFWPHAQRRSEVACGVGVAAFLLLLIATVVALNLPALTLGAVV